MVAWLIIIAISSMMLFVIITRTLRRLRPTRGDATSYDFSIEQLVRLHQAGQISADEFERAKAEVLARRTVEPVDPTKRGFEVLQAQRPTFQSLEERSAP
jgi:hypothetical protein